MLAAGVDPAEHRKAAKAAGAAAAANSFEVVAREWYAKHASSWVASHGERILRRLERDVFPHIGSRPVSQLAAPELLALIRRIETLAQHMILVCRAIRDPQQRPLASLAAQMFRWFRESAGDRTALSCADVQMISYSVEARP